MIKLKAEWDGTFKTNYAEFPKNFSKENAVEIIEWMNEHNCSTFTLELEGDDAPPTTLDNGVV